MRTKSVITWSVGLFTALAVAIGGVLLPPMADAAGKLVVMQDTNVREAPNPEAVVVKVLKPGDTIIATGLMKDGWHPVKVDDKPAWVKAEYVKHAISVVNTGANPAPKVTITVTPKPSAPVVAPTPKPSAPVVTPKPSAPVVTPKPSAPVVTPKPSAPVVTPMPSPTPTIPTVAPTPPQVDPQLPKPVTPTPGKTVPKYATEEVWVRTEPNDRVIIAKLPTNSVVQTTGRIFGTYSEIMYNGALRYVRTIDLADQPVANTGWSKGLDKLQPSASRLVTVVREKFPEIATIYGYRPYDPYPDHPSGRAIDLMIPRYKDNTELGWRICQHLMENAKAYNIKYLIYQQSYWDTSYGVTRNWKRMSDRGGDTANHYDHIHITVNK